MINDYRSRLMMVTMMIMTGDGDYVNDYDDFRRRSIMMMMTIDGYGNR